ncbi:hypothetical protein EU520_00130 [Candidatus Thorarchaeota archaeon]|nr:MAG: hypothetical protein EU520_00130 [Candidatus Thorarchaeota archaeon]
MTYHRLWPIAQGSESESLTMKVLVPYGDEIVNQIRQVIGSQAEVIQSERTAEDMLKTASDAIAVASGRVPGEYIRRAEKLRMIQAFGAGINKIDLDAVREREDVFVCNSHVNAAEVAEYAVMLLLAVSKNIIVNDRELRKGDWRYGWGGPSPNIEIRRKQALIIGLGSVGSELAKRLRCFNLHLSAVTRTGESPNSHLVDNLTDPTSLAEEVPVSDFVFLTLPLTSETKGLVDDEFLSWMKSTSILINISRGPIVDEAALYHALDEKRIHGAGLDVWWHYPDTWGGSGVPPSRHFPFHTLDNVVISPHRAAYSEHIMHDQIRFVGENLLRFIRGEKPLNIIDLSLGY